MNMLVKEIIFTANSFELERTVIYLAFALWLKKRGIEYILVDAGDSTVSASDFLKPHIIRREKIHGNYIARIDVNECIHCNICFDTCRFDAISNKGPDFTVEGTKCNGCGICAHACPLKGIDMIPKIVGEWYLSNTTLGKLFYGNISEKQPINIRHLLTIIRKQGSLFSNSEEFPFVLTNSPSMEQCRVRNIISGASYVILITDENFENENIHSLLKLSDSMNIPSFLVSVDSPKESFATLFHQYPMLTYAGPTIKFSESMNGNIEKVITEYSSEMAPIFKIILKSIKKHNGVELTDILQL